MEQKSKSTLALMEQVIMILVFAVTAAFCVQAFVKAELLSRQLSERDKAVGVCQTAAETVKALHGNMEQAADFLGGTAGKEEFVLYYSKTWEHVSKQEAEYTLLLSLQEETEYLAKGEVTVFSATGEEIFSLPVNWQREVSHE